MATYANYDNGILTTIDAIDIEQQKQQEYAKHGIDAILQKQHSNKQLANDEAALLLLKKSIDDNIDSKWHVFIDAPVPDYTDEQCIEAVIEVNGDEIHRNWKVIDFNANHVNVQITKLKKQLADTDYIVIKAYEAVIMGEAASDTVKAQIEERRKLREQINELEAQLEAHNWPCMH